MPERRSPAPAWHPLAWADALTQFGRTEQAGGVVLVLALTAALIWANTDAHSYLTLWAQSTGALHGALGTPTLRTVGDLVDNGLMTIFFLAVGIEIGREVAEGSLRDRRNALLPMVAALGGMAGAALIYLAVTAVVQPPTSIAGGWGVPMATDVAFTLGAVALLGTRVPRALRVFVLALAVADDVASVIVLAIVASTRPRWAGWLGAVAVLAALVLLRRRVQHAWWPYALAAVAAWYLFARAGVEAPLSGAFVGLLIPVARGATAGHRLEGPVHALSSYAVLPLFVLANAGVTITAAVWRSNDAVSVLVAVISARTVGKMLGIVAGHRPRYRPRGVPPPRGHNLASCRGHQSALRHGHHRAAALRPCRLRCGLGPIRRSPARPTHRDRRRGRLGRWRAAERRSNSRRRPEPRYGPRRGRSPP